MFGLHIMKQKKRIERAPARMSAKCERSSPSARHSTLAGGKGARLRCTFIHDSRRASMAVGGDDYRLEFTPNLSGLLEL